MLSYLKLAERIIHSGTLKPSRPRINTFSLFAPQLRHDMQDGFPLLTTKKVNFNAIKMELLWFLRGSINTQWLNDHGVHIWDHWAREDGHVGPIYGVQWRRWMDYGSGFPIDQLRRVITQIRNNPYDRRLIVSAWNPAEIQLMALPPCHVMFQFLYDSSRLNLHMYQRSADWMIGVPFNIASYALLLHMVCAVTGHTPGELVVSYGDAHIYENHKKGVYEQLRRDPRDLPKLGLFPKHEIDDYQPEDIHLTNYDPHPAIKFEVAV